MISNATVLNKADLVVQDLINDAGYLLPAQAQRFVRLLIDEPTIMNRSRVIPMRSPVQLIEKIRFGSRILMAAAENTALDAEERSAPDLSLVELRAGLFRAEVRLSDEVLEDSIEKESFRDTIIQLMAHRVALDMEELAVNGNTASADQFYKNLDGLMIQASSNLVDHAGNSTNKALFNSMLKAMPTEFKREVKALNFLVSADSAIDWRNALADRGTILGDRYITEDVPAPAFGVPVYGVPTFPQNLVYGGVAEHAQALLTHPKNVAFGIYRNIRIETDKDVSAGQLIIVLSVRWDVKFTESTAVVRADNVRVSPSGAHVGGSSTDTILSDASVRGFGITSTAVGRMDQSTYSFIPETTGVALPVTYTGGVGSDRDTTGA